MDSQALRRKVAASPLAPVAAFPGRLRTVARHDGAVIRRSARWLVQSRERTNYTYDLTPLNREHLAWFVAQVANQPVAVMRAYMEEIENDSELQQHVLSAVAASPLRRLADERLGLAKRIGWYALVRALRPEHVVETGTDKGLGSCTLAAALLRNGTGRLTTIDITSHAGYLITGRYAGVVDVVTGDSVLELGRMQQPVDVFLHDSLHTVEYETAEFEAVAHRLSAEALVLSDNPSVALPAWAERTGRRFLFFAEEPRDHWYPGGGIGAAFG